MAQWNSHPLVGLADAIVDLVSSGKTLQANRLEAVEEIQQISSRLIVSATALKLKHDLVQPIIDSFGRKLI
jgi:ATP phosphoribosyltransferase